jgi:hypothetical protein
MAFTCCFLSAAPAEAQAMARTMTMTMMRFMACPLGTTTYQFLVFSNSHQGRGGLRKCMGLWIAAAIASGPE